MGQSFFGLQWQNAKLRKKAVRIHCKAEQRGKRRGPHHYCVCCCLQSISYEFLWRHHLSCHLFIVIWVFPTGAEATDILAIAAAIKPDNQDRQSDWSRDTSLRNLNVHQLPETKLEEQEKPMCRSVHVCRLGVVILWLIEHRQVSLWPLHCGQGVCQGVSAQCRANTLPP